jgi:hypothetical protein
MTLSTTSPLPTFYKVRDQMVPAKLTLAQRAIFLQGLGVSQSAAVALGMQDGSASLIAKLQSLIETTGDKAALTKCNELIGRWNQECDDLLGVRH